MPNRPSIQLIPKHGTKSRRADTEDDPAFEGGVLGGWVKWMRKHAPYDVGTLTARDVDDVADITVVTGRSPYDPVKL